MNLISKVIVCSTMAISTMALANGVYFVSNVDATVPFASILFDVQDTQTPLPLLRTNRTGLKVKVDNEVELSTVGGNDYLTYQFPSIGLHKVRVYCGDIPSTKNPALYFQSLPHLKKLIQYPSDYGSIWVKSCSNLVVVVQRPQDADYNVASFTYCTALETVSLPNATNVLVSAFQGCISLKNVYLPKAKTLNQNAFQNCVSLQEIDLPQLEVIASGCFGGCTNLARVSANNAKSIGANAFQSFANLVEVSALQATNILGSAFNNCASLKTLNAPNVEYLGTYAMASCLSLEVVDFPTAKTVAGQCFAVSRNLKSISIPNATSIGSYAFRNCDSLAYLNVSQFTMEEVQSQIGTSGDKWRIPPSCKTIVCKDGTITQP